MYVENCNKIVDLHETKPWKSVLILKIRLTKIDLQVGAFPRFFSVVLLGLLMTPLFMSFGITSSILVLNGDQLRSNRMRWTDDQIGGDKHVLQIVNGLELEVV